MNPRLIELGDEKTRAREIAIQGEEFLIGRGTDCDLRLPVSDVSRHHCLLRVRGDEATITDLGSANGTFVNGKRVRSQSTVHSRDEIRIGPCRFTLDLGGAVDLRSAGEPDPTAATCRMPNPQLDKRGSPPSDSPES